MSKILHKSIFLLAIGLVCGFAKPLVSVSIPPQKYFVEKIAASTLDINVIIPASTDEHNFDFKPATIKKLEKSDIYFTIGLEFERVFADKFQSNFANLQVIDTGKDLRNLKTSHEHSENAHKSSHDEDAHTHLRGENSQLNDKNSHTHNVYEHHAHKHSNSHETHSENDPHIWLDPILVKIQASTIAKALIAKYPQNKALYEANLAQFQAELDALNAEISALFKKSKNKKFIIYHPSLGYFAARYHLVQIPVEIEGKEPKTKDLQRLMSVAKKENIKTIFVQKGFSQNAAKSLAKELKASVVELNHLSDDYSKNLLEITKKIAQ